MSKSCVICGGEESDCELLLGAPCGDHFVCSDDVGSFFERATQNESLFPPRCCGQIFMLQDYDEYVPFDIAWAYQVKEQGEYATLPKFRIYCANPPCGKFLHPSSHIEDSDSKITYAICESDDCGKTTCVKCRTQIDQDTQNHVCEQNENDVKFKQTAAEKGYQECSNCGATVELAEACNHIMCDCGSDFCYICGKDWTGIHGCPHYGPADYDEEGYNQDGFHRDTSLNRDGLTRRQNEAQLRADDADDEGVDEDDVEWDVLQHLTLDQRVMLNILDHENRADAMDQLRIQLFETRGILFNQGQPQPDEIEDSNDNEDSENDDHDEEDEDDENDEDGEDDESDEDDEEDDDDGAEVDQDGLVTIERIFQDHDGMIRTAEVPVLANNEVPESGYENAELFDLDDDDDDYYVLRIDEAAGGFDDLVEDLFRQHNIPFPTVEPASSAHPIDTDTSDRPAIGLSTDASDTATSNELYAPDVPPTHLFAGLRVSEIPPAYLDPLNRTIMSDPVTLPADGTVMDRVVIEEFSRIVLPFDDTPLNTSDLVPADALRKEIQSWKVGLQHPEGDVQPQPQTQSPGSSVDGEHL